MRLYLKVAVGTEHGYTLMVHDIPEREVAPGPDDRVMLWDDGSLWPVRERWFDHDGTQSADLKTMVIDPTDRDVQSEVWRKYNGVWWSEGKWGQEWVLAKLAASGWEMWRRPEGEEG